MTGCGNLDFPAPGLEPYFAKSAAHLGNPALSWALTFVKGRYPIFSPKLVWIPCSYTLEPEACQASLRRVVPESRSLGGFVDTQKLVALHVMKDLPDAAWPSDTYFFDGRLIAQPEMHSLVPRR